MAVIAMTQEMATMGKDVALGVCEALGLQQVRHEVGDHVAGMMHVKKSLIRRIREGKASRIEKWAADEKTISIFTAEEVLELAVKGDVLIRGWGATQILRPVPHIACVRVCAPMGVRVKRLMERLESDDEDLAGREIEMDDAARASRIAEHFNVVWGDPTLYDLTLNTERMPVATCVDQIVALVKSPAFAQTADSLQLLADLALRAKVRAVLKSSPVTQDIDVAIEAHAGKITLSGIVVDEAERQACEATVAAIDGVTATENHLKTMSGGMFRFPTQPRHS
jgi:cytidylate kinase